MSTWDKWDSRSSQKTRSYGGILQFRRTLPLVQVIPEGKKSPRVSGCIGSCEERVLAGSKGPTRIYGLVAWNDGTGLTHLFLTECVWHCWLPITPGDIEGLSGGAATRRWGKSHNRSVNVEVLPFLTSPGSVGRHYCLSQFRGAVSDFRRVGWSSTSTVVFHTGSGVNGGYHRVDEQHVPDGVV